MEKRGKLRTGALCGKLLTAANPREAASQLVFFDVATITNQSEIVDDWPSHDASEARISDLSMSDSEASQPAPSASRSRLRPARGCLDICAICWLGARTVVRRRTDYTIQHGMETVCKEQEPGWLDRAKYCNIAAQVLEIRPPVEAD
jgi:hypothetical protein